MAQIPGTSQTELVAEAPRRPSDWCGRAAGTSQAQTLDERMKGGEASMPVSWPTGNGPSQLGPAGLTECAECISKSWLLTVRSPTSYNDR